MRPKPGLQDTALLEGGRGHCAATAREMLGAPRTTCICVYRKHSICPHFNTGSKYSSGFTFLQKITKKLKRASLGYFLKYEGLFLSSLRNFSYQWPWPELIQPWGDTEMLKGYESFSKPSEEPSEIRRTNQNKPLLYMANIKTNNLITSKCDTSNIVTVSETTVGWGEPI